jgi:hypothetical protein
MMIAVLFSLGGIGLPGREGTVRAASMTVDVDLGFFYDRLAPYGDWREHPRWGWTWYPHDVAVDWRPYTLGHWVYTDEFGWMWESDEDWGWACFHYGRWDWDDDFGWYWVPGYHWGPGWVAWRTSPEFIGWCPLPPEVRWEPGFGLDFGRYDIDDIPSRRWVFVEGRFFDAPRIHNHVVLVSRNVTLLRDTRPIARFESVDGRIVDRSISAGQVEYFTHRPVERFHVRYVDSAPAMRLGRERDGEVAVFSPRIRREEVGIAPPRGGELERRQRVERGQLMEQQRAERARQQERHETERAAPNVNREQMQRRQEAERGALQAEHERQSRILENRQQQERGQFQRPGGTFAPRGNGGRIRR